MKLLRIRKLSFHKTGIGRKPKGILLAEVLKSLLFFLPCCRLQLFEKAVHGFLQHRITLFIKHSIVNLAFGGIGKSSTIRFGKIALLL